MNKKILLWILALLFIVGSVNATLIFQENFTGADDTQIKGYNNWECVNDFADTKISGNEAIIVRGANDDTCSHNISFTNISIGTSLNYSVQYRTSTGAGNFVFGICPKLKTDANNFCGGWNLADGVSTENSYLIKGSPANIHLYKWIGGVETEYALMTSSISDGDYFKIEILKNSTGQFINTYQNNIKKLSVSDDSITNFSAIGIGAWTNVGYDNININSETPTPLIISSNADLLFNNETDNIYKDTFGEGENFYTFLNLTYDNGSSIESSSCNFTYYDAITEVESLDNNFTVCSSGCDYSEFKEEFEIVDIGTDIQQDFIRFRTCSENL